jgi:hypothetical protein
MFSIMLHVEFLSRTEWKGSTNHLCMQIEGKHFMNEMDMKHVNLFTTSLYSKDENVRRLLYGFYWENIYLHVFII